MKKIILATVVSFTIMSCTKQKSVSPQTASANIISTDQQIADLINKGDKDMYNRIYGGNKSAKPSTHFHYGVFYVADPNHPENGTCIYNTSCMCMFCIEAYAQVNDNSPTDEIKSDFHRTWTNLGDAELFINDANSTVIKDLKSLDVTFNQNLGSTFHYTTIK